jgi:ribosomal protein S18 acetylase RimI-like enzyme
LQLAHREQGSQLDRYAGEVALAASLAIDDAYGDLDEGAKLSQAATRLGHLPARGHDVLNVSGEPIVHPRVSVTGSVQVPSLAPTHARDSGLAPWDTRSSQTGVLICWSGDTGRACRANEAGLDTVGIVSANVRTEENSTRPYDLLDGVRRLVGQLVSSPGCRLLTARNDDDDLLGMLTLVLLRIPTGVRAWIEDVVVDEVARGQGVGGRLIDHAVMLARDAGARTIDLTSRPDREAASALYLRAGFELRTSNVYRIRL